MLNDLAIYVLYGPGTALSLKLRRDGTYDYAIQGNVVPLFPTLEMGTYAGVDPNAVGAFFQTAEKVLLQASSNPRPFPDAAFVSVEAGEMGNWLFDLYDLPGGVRPLFGPLFAWVEGPGRGGKVKTLTLKAAWAQPTVSAGQSLRSTLELKNTGRQGLVVSTPRGETLEFLFADASPGADPENYGLATGSSVRISTTAASVLAGNFMALGPGTSLSVTAEVVFDVRPGTYRTTLSYRSQEADWERAPAPGLKGVLSVELGLVRIG